MEEKSNSKLESIVEEWNKIKYKTVDQLSEVESKKIRLWSDHMEIGIELFVTEDMIINDIDLEIKLIKYSLKIFNDIYEGINILNPVERIEAINSYVNFYGAFINMTCYSDEAEYIRISYIETYKKYQDAFKALLVPTNEKKTSIHDLKFKETSNEILGWDKENLKVEIKKLYVLLKAKEYINSNTSENELLQIFFLIKNCNQKPVKWLKSNRLLTYLLDSLFTGQSWQSWMGKGKCFCNSKTTLKANDYAVAKNGYSIEGQPKGHEEIDKIVKEIKNIKNLKSS